MNRITPSLTLVLTLILLTACGGNTPQTPPETEAPTEAITQPTAAPAEPATEDSATESATEAEPESTEAAASGTVSYAGQIAPIFEAKCIKCHGVESKKEGLDMLTYDNIMAGSRNGSVITPGNAADSLLVQLIVEGEMPNRGPKLLPEELQLITDWVNQGALNN